MFQLTVHDDSNEQVSTFSFKEAITPAQAFGFLHTQSYLGNTRIDLTGLLGPEVIVKENGEFLLAELNLSIDFTKEFDYSDEYIMSDEELKAFIDEFDL